MENTTNTMNLAIGVEVLTGEYFAGKPVYEKLLDVGTLPNNADKNINIGLINPYYAWIDPSNSLCFQAAAGYPFPYVSPYNINDSITGRLHSWYTVLTISTKADWSGYSGIVAIKYVKK